MKKSFTLIELIVVIAIIAVLAAVISVNAFKAIEKSKISKMAADFKALKTAWLSLYTDVGDFTTEQDYIAAGIPRQNGIGQFMSETDIASNVLNLDGWDGPYYEGVDVSPWAARYLYDNDNNRPYDPNSLPFGPFGGVNVALSESAFKGDTTIVVPKIDRTIDDGDPLRGSLRYVTPSMRIFYLIYTH